MAVHMSNTTIIVESSENYDLVLGDREIGVDLHGVPKLATTYKLFNRKYGVCEAETDMLPQGLMFLLDFERELKRVRTMKEEANAIEALSSTSGIIIN
jgi:hypothetical protein